ncbi:hypothetical protein J6590_057942 [Homalodisca vitripennis]|nr:hypothetical protein J6590_057942 [Homalodisca vitripennis]
MVACPTCVKYTILRDIHTLSLIHPPNLAPVLSTTPLTCRIITQLLPLTAKLGLRQDLTLNLETNGLKMTSEPPSRQAGCLQGQDHSALSIQAAATLDIA